MKKTSKERARAENMKILSIIPVLIILLGVLFGSKYYTGINGWLVIVGVIILWFTLDVFIYLQKVRLKKNLDNLSQKDVNSLKHFDDKVEDFKKAPNLGKDFLKSFGILLEIALFLFISCSFCYLVLIIRHKHFSWTDNLDFISIASFFAACGLYVGLRKLFILLYKKLFKAKVASDGVQ